MFMKKIFRKQKIAVIISIVFFLTSIAVNAKNFIQDIKYIFYNKSIQADNKNLMKNSDIKEHILKLSNTLGEAIEYIKNNVNSKDKLQELKSLTDDSIIALESIENALNKSENTSNLIEYTEKLKENFKELKTSLEELKMDKAEKIINFSIEKEYENWRNKLSAL